ncbi:hypothetical protein [Neobacillus sp. DY30]|uniref:hypothetical protein n=1 Tax=Neobacillus sp. DY30 TaxID=3047871 RepID=UPI0024C08E4C|nr:hypothetical protein [Neobacillus sp. DY30]WHX98454.1 hypothetical protein QNH29_17550 [Neobacillus sp. DY30]
MNNEITNKQLMELFLDTIQRCGTHLYNMDDETIEYEIFEEFDIGVVSFLHNDSLSKLYSAGLISYEVMQKGLELRQKVQDLQNSGLWNMEALKRRNEWKEVFILSDEIRTMLD